jgi:putative ABC transport system permease protein
MINTLAAYTVERRRQVRLLARLGTTRRQLGASFGWQGAFVTVVGAAAGAAVCGGTLASLTRAVTGSPVPYVPVGLAGLVVSAVAAIAAVAIMTPFTAISGRARFSGRLPLDKSFLVRKNR